MKNLERQNDLFNNSNVNFSYRDTIQDVDISGIFEALGLQQHITAQRRNGFYAMVERIKSYGEAGD